VLPIPKRRPIPSRSNQSQTGPSAADERTNLPDEPNQIANLEIGLNLKIESHGIIIPWLSSLYMQVAVPPGF
jgi:hypothetical protein